MLFVERFNMIGAKLVICRQIANPARRSEPQTPHAAHQSPACNSLTTTAGQPYRLDKIRRRYLGIYGLSSRVAHVTSFFRRKSNYWDQVLGECLPALSNTSLRHQVLFGNTWHLRNTLADMSRCSQLTTVEHNSGGGVGRLKGSRSSTITVQQAQPHHIRPNRTGPMILAIR